MQPNGLHHPIVKSSKQKACELSYMGVWRRGNEGILTLQPSECRERPCCC